MKTLLMFKSQILGFVDEELKEGEVIKISGNEDPLLISLVQDNIGADKKFDKIAYLKYNDEAIKKFTRKKTSQKLEKQMAKTLKGHVTPGSGAFSGHKGDVKSKEWLGEHKYTDAIQYRLNKSIWNKIKNEALEVNKTPILEIILDQSNKCLRLMFMDIRDFQEKTSSSEEEFLKLFHVTNYKSKSESILLKLSEIEKFTKVVTSTSDFRLPGIFITFPDKLTLFGILSHHFEEVFND